MLNKLFYTLVIMTALQGCAKTDKIEYKYPQNQDEKDREKIGSLMPEGALYLIKSSESNK